MCLSLDYYLQQNLFLKKVKLMHVIHFRKTAFAMISETVERALSFTSKKELMIVGGVAANKRLSAMLKDVCKRHGCKFFCCTIAICWRLW